MGNTILIQTREVDEHVPFIPPDWAYKFSEEDLPNRYLTPTGENFWWLELGGMENTIRDAEKLRDELLKVAFGVWSLIKNHPDGRARNWELEWIGSLPGKRESVRYLGDHVLTQGDVLAGGQFEDVVAYGGWTMDDHHPGGLYYRGPATVFHETPSPYGIPYRSLYSRNVANLLFAGRNISASHMAMSSTRVMGTCSLLGQAVGTAAALAVQYSCSPREVYQHHLAELQAALMEDDAYLPGLTRAIPALSRQARLDAAGGDVEALRNGRQRSQGAEDNGWWAAAGDEVCYDFGRPVSLERARLVFDSDLTKTKRMPCWYPKSGTQGEMPAMLPRAFEIQALNPAGAWETLKRVEENHARLVKLPLGVEAAALRFKLLESWGGERAHLMEFDVSETPG